MYYYFIKLDLIKQMRNVEILGGLKVENEKLILIKNVSIFNGKDKDYIKGKSVVIKGNKISSIVDKGVDESDFDTVIDGKGGYLSPGFIDAHWHTVMGTDMNTFLNSDPSYIQIFSAVELKKILMRGVTSLRDAGGNVFALKKSIDEGMIQGPRIYPSGALLSQYSGHVDFRRHSPTTLPKEWGGPTITPGEADGHMLLANGVDEVIKGARHQLYLGASQIKICVSGGVSSYSDPLYVLEYTDEEIRAAVKIAEDYGTYVMAHAHNSESVIRAVKNGVKSIEHGTMLNEKAAIVMAEHGAVLVPQVRVLKDLKTIYTDPVRSLKLNEAFTGTDTSLKLAKKYNLTIGWGTDLIFSQDSRERQLKDLSDKKSWFSSSEIMIQATGNNGDILGLSGKRNPYGKIGVIEENSMADILIYNKDFLDDISIIEDYKNNLKLIIKDGEIKKNIL